jgi:hypothetical protein
MALTNTTLMEHSNSPDTRGPEDGNLRLRIQAEYREMPGLRLTLVQASRLFNIEPLRCAQALEALVSGGVLWTDGRTFLDAGVGRRWA